MPGRRATESHPETFGYIARIHPALRESAEELAGLVRAAAPDAEERIKYGCPMWALGGKDFCYLHARQDDVGLGFQRGSELDDPQKLLTALGAAKDARHVRVRPGGKVPAAAVRALVRQAAAFARG